MREQPWWRSAVVYQIYSRSFADANGDGVGDLEGIVRHLDHLAWLGVDALWLTPITSSPNADWGYDVSDYTSVDPDFGDLGSLDRLVAEAGALGIRVIVDLVPNHTSEQHPWFVDARSSRTSRHRDWYVWADPSPDGGPPNNWRSTFGGPAWTFDPVTNQYYLHNFLREQPDLNWWNEEVRAAFDEILKFWLDRGVAGVRIDVAQGLVKDRELRDNPAATEEDHAFIRAGGLRPVYNANRPEVHDIYRRWRTVADTCDPPGLLMGETWVLDLDDLVRFYGDGSDELDLAQNFPFMFADFGEATRAVVEATEARLPAGAWPVWAASNHDGGRFPTRWCGGDDRKIRAALLMLLTLRGTPILYYGDELGMPEVPVPPDRMLDPVGLRGLGGHMAGGRDRMRTPMPWTEDPGAGFTSPGVEPWLPVGVPGVSVERQREDSGSVLHLCRETIALRRERPDLALGPVRAMPAPDGVWAWRRGERTAVALDLSDRPAEVPVGPATVLIATRGGRAGEVAVDRIRLDPWEGVVLEVEP